MHETTLPYPMCALCNKRVETMKLENDFRTNSVIAVAYCHGEREICEVPIHIILDNGRLDAGVAFSKLKLESVKKLNGDSQ